MMNLYRFYSAKNEGLIIFILFSVIVVTNFLKQLDGINHDDNDINNLNTKNYSNSKH